MEHESSAATATTAPPDVTFSVWRDAPLRSEPFVSRSTEYPEDEANVPNNNNVVDTVRGGTAGWIALSQCRGTRIDARLHDGTPIWNDYWVLAKGMNGTAGWISMVDVVEGHDGERLPGFHAARYEWKQVGAG